jgi:hypothetical protein
MRHIRLEAFDDDYGNLGLIIAGTPKNDRLMSDTDGRLLAHDLLEHQNGPKKIGCPIDELEAVGALWQVRGRHGDFVQTDRNIGSHWTPEQNVALNLTTIAEESHWMDTAWVPGRYRTQRCDEDEVFVDMIEWVRPHVRDHLNGCDLESPFPMDAYLDNALHLMRTGYRKARRRFGSGYRGIDTFRAIVNAVAPVARSIEYDGQQFRLSYGDGRARCEEIYEGDY